MPWPPDLCIQPASFSISNSFVQHLCVRGPRSRPLASQGTQGKLAKLQLLSAESSSNAPPGAFHPYASLGSMKEVVTVSLGHAGAQLGTQFWQQLAREHEISPTGHFDVQNSCVLCSFQCAIVRFFVGHLCWERGACLHLVPTSLRRCAKHVLRCS